MWELEEPHGNECSMGVTDVLSVKQVVGVVMGCQKKGFAETAEEKGFAETAEDHVYHMIKEH